MEERLDKRIVRGYRPWIYARPSFSSAPPRMCMSILRAAKILPARHPVSLGVRLEQVQGLPSGSMAPVTQQTTTTMGRSKNLINLCFFSSFVYLKAVHQTRDAPCRCRRRSRPRTAHASTPAPRAARPNAPPAPHPSIVRSRRLRLHLASGPSRMSQSASIM